MQSLLKPFFDQYDSFIDELNSGDELLIGTLGPNGTSSELATEYLISSIKSYNTETKCKTYLLNNFKLVFDALNDELINYALIPTAYEHVTDFFWNKDFENNLNFIFPTPQYGMVCKGNFKPILDSKVKIACGPGVENIIPYLSDGIIKSSEFEKVKTNSSTESIISVINGSADIAITNQTSFDLYAYEDIKFVSKKYNANIVWSLFKKTNLKISCNSSY
jgi:hypothetical protein